MANGIYVAASGTVSRLQEMEVLAHNLAHARAPGFKADRVTFESVAAEERGGRPVDGDKDFVQTREPAARLEEGVLTRTDNPLDVAVAGPGFLRVATERGERLTRNGRLMVGVDGTLRTLAGHQVLDEGGRSIPLPPDRVPVIDEGGRIRAGDLEIARLGVTRVDLRGTLERDVAGLFVPPAQPAPADATPVTVLQGHVEEGNVDPVATMVELVEVQRHYEALHQVIATYREMDQTAVRLPRG